MSIGVSELILILFIILLLFGADKLPKLMGDVGKSIRNLKAGLKQEEQVEIIDQQDKDG